MFIRKFKHLALTGSIAALVCPSAHAASTITIYVSPALSDAVTDMVTDFIAVTNIAGPLDASGNPTSLGYAVSLQVLPDAGIKDAVTVASDGTAIAPATMQPDLILTQSPTVPSALITSGYSLDSNLRKIAKDTVVMYSGADKAANIAYAITKTGTLDDGKLAGGKAKIAIPDWTTKDPYGVSAYNYLYQWDKNLLSKYWTTANGRLVVSDSVGAAYASVRYLPDNDPSGYGADVAFTGLSQICTALAGQQQFEPGSNYWLLPATYDVQFYGLELANAGNSSTTIPTPPAVISQAQELTDFVNYLTGNLTGNLANAAKSGKDALAAHCFH